MEMGNKMMMNPRVIPYVMSRMYLYGSLWMGISLDIFQCPTQVNWIECHKPKITIQMVKFLSAMVRDGNMNLESIPRVTVNWSP
jgi:hypothetical protein